MDQNNRTVNLDINTAKEWYNKGGELKSVALQAFTEQELNLKVQVWHNLPKLDGFYISGSSEISRTLDMRALHSNKNIALTKKHCKKMLAIAQISQLMPYYGGEITDEEWNDGSINKYVILRKENKINIYIITYSFYGLLAFHTIKQAKNFLKYNECLVKDYYMMD